MSDRRVLRRSYSNGCLKIVYEGVTWIYLAQDKVHCRARVNIAMKKRVPYRVGNHVIGWAIFNFSRRSLFHDASELLNVIG